MASTTTSPNIAGMFNDATRILEGGLWHNEVAVGNQGNGTDLRYVKDMTAVENGLNGLGTLATAQAKEVAKILADITTALNAVQGALANDPTAEKALRAAQLDIIGTIGSDPALAALTNSTDSSGQTVTISAAPQELAMPVSASTPHRTFAELGAIFDDAQSKSLGGINADNLPAIQADLTMVRDGLKTLMTEHPQLFGGATGIHAATIVDQLNLQITNFDHQYGVNPDAAKATNDNFLDITDIVEGDDNLKNMATSGWTPAPAAAKPPVQFADNADQTTFWAEFIASSNTLGAKAEQLVATGSSNQIKAFEATLKGWEQNVANFDGAQGGIFEARFDNELLGQNSTIGADVAAMIQGLETHNATLVKLAADGFHANAADVGGNNVPIGGTAADPASYNTDATTAIDALVGTTATLTAIGSLIPQTPSASAQTQVISKTDQQNNGAPANVAPVTQVAAVVAGSTSPPATSTFAGMFNDATRILEGGLWHNEVAVGNQGNGTDLRYVKDMTAAENALNALGTVPAAQAGDVSNIVKDITAALVAVPGAVANDPKAEAALRAAQLDIINIVQKDPGLATLTNFADSSGQSVPAAPQELAMPVSASTPHRTFAELGAIFDDAQSKSLGGINADNLPAIQADLTMVRDGLKTLMTEHPQLFGGATGIHAATIVDQLNLQITNFDHQYGVNPDAAKATNDNFLDITDIVEGDDNLKNMATSGWTPAPAAAKPPVQFADNADQTTFWAEFIASSNTLGAKAEQLVATGSSNQIKAFEATLKGWEQNVANFDGAQGGIFEARFDNELLGQNSTIGADVAAMIQGLETHNATLVKLAADGFHANAADVGGNNVPIGGTAADPASYNTDATTAIDALVGTTATLTAIGSLIPQTPSASAQTQVISKTDQQNNGAPANVAPVTQVAAVVAGSTSPPATPTFAGMFNDATRILEGGLWHNEVAVGNQGNGTDLRYVKDMTAAENALNALGTVPAAQAGDVSNIVKDITAALVAVPGAVANDPKAEAALRAAQLDIINIVQKDPGLATLTNFANSSGQSVPAAPQELAMPVSASTPHRTFAELGAIFDDAQSKSLGGINADNLPAIQADLTMVRDGLKTLMTEHPQLFGGATGIHAATIVDQLNLQITNFDHQYGVNPDAAKATNDNFLDITDIVEGDDNLKNMATSGWTPAPAAAKPPVQFADNADQTTFWAEFIASSNTLGAKAEQLVATGSSNQIKAFEATLKGWEQNVANFDGAQGGIFEARFDNELLGQNSTIGADVAAMIQGLETHNATLVKLAADGFHANAADVGGNNVPIGGTAADPASYNTDATTAIDALVGTTATLTAIGSLIPQTPSASVKTQVISKTDHQADSPKIVDNSGLERTITLGGGDQFVTLTGAGHDTLVLGGGINSVLIQTGSATVLGGSGASTIQGGSGTLTFLGGSGIDKVMAGSGDARLIGGSGSETFVAGTGHTFMQAGQGATTFVGGHTEDVMIGNSFAMGQPDLFSFSAAQSGGQHLIQDFVQGHDKLQLVGYNIADVLAHDVSQTNTGGQLSTVLMPDQHTKITLSGFSGHLTAADFQQA